MKQKRFAAVLISFILLTGLSVMATAPVVEKVSSSSHPAIPSGLKQSCKCGPNTLEQCPTCPVIKWNGYTYWAYSFIDNRYAMSIVAYDASGKMVKRVDKNGARYVWKITIDEAGQKVTLWGQANKTIGLSFKELMVPPEVVGVNPSSHPAIPSGLKTACLKGPDTLDSCTAYPVVKWNGYTYWPYSFIDNRDAMAIVAYDSAGKMVKRLDKNGARYIYKITVDDAAQKVTFWGQANKTIVLSFKELIVPPAVVGVKPSSHPAIPSGLKTSCSKGPDTLDSCTAYPVVKWNGYTYWAYSFIDNRYAMAIVAYNSAGKMIKRWDKKGARYIYKITVDEKAQKVTFWGQSNKTVTMTFSEFLL